MYTRGVRNTSESHSSSIGLLVVGRYCRNLVVSISGSVSCSVHLAVWWGCRTIVADQERLDRTLVGVQHRGPSLLEPPQNVKDYEGR